MIAFSVAPSRAMKILDGKNSVSRGKRPKNTFAANCTANESWQYIDTTFANVYIGQ
jgi:hypothetical protein